MRRLLLIISLLWCCSVPVHSWSTTICATTTRTTTLGNLCSDIFNYIIKINSAGAYHNTFCSIGRPDPGPCTRDQRTVLERCHGHRSCELDASTSEIDLPGCFESKSNSLYIDYDCYRVPSDAVTLPLPQNTPFESSEMVIFNQGFAEGTASGPKSYSCHVRPSANINVRIKIWVDLVQFESTDKDCDESLELKTGSWERKFCSQRNSRFLIWNQEAEEVPLQNELTISFRRIHDNPEKRFWLRLEGLQSSGSGRVDISLACPSTNTNPPRPGPENRNQGEVKEDEELNLAPIIGGAAGGLVLLIIILVVVAALCYRRRSSAPPDVVTLSQIASGKKKSNQKDSENNEYLQPVDHIYMEILHENKNEDTKYEQLPKQQPL